MSSQGDIVVVVDDQDNVLEYLDESLFKPYMRRRDTMVILQNKAGQILLARRHPNKKILPNKWSISASGTVESHESYEQNAYKELAEEIGVTNIKLRHIGNFCVDYDTHHRYSGIFYGEYNGKITDLKLEQDEVAEARWANLVDIEQELLNAPDIYAPGTQLLLDLALQPLPPEQAILVDDQDNIVGTKNRDDLADGDQFRISIVMVQNNKGELLAHKRSSAKKSYPNFWENSAGGLVAYGESYLQNARRELFEETGLHSVTLEPLGIHHIVTPHGNRMAGWFLATTTWPISQFRPNPQEVAELKWVPKQELFDWRDHEPQNFMPSSSLWRQLLA